MSHLEIISWDCSDIDDIDTWIPADPEDVDFWMNFTIGVDGAGHDYQVHVLSPKNIDARARKAGGLIVLSHYSWADVLDHVQGVLAEAPETTSGGMEYVARYFCWEYEDYKR